MRIIITGALGHIGSALIRKLPEKFPQSELILIDNLLTQRYPSLFDLSADYRYRFLEGDILDLDFSSILQQGDIVIHLAAITNAAASFANKEAIEKVNFEGTLRLASACASQGARLIHPSSTSVYGTQSETVDENCSDEELKPQSPYAESKLREEKLLAQLGREEGLAFVACRFGTISGVSPGMRFHTAVNKFCWQVVMGQSLTVWRTALHQKRPYLELNDACDAICFILNRELFDNNVYNILTENLTVNHIIGYLQEPFPGLNVEFVDTEIMNQLSYEVLAEKIRDKGFHATGSIRQAIRDTLEKFAALNHKPL